MVFLNYLNRVRNPQGTEKRLTDNYNTRVISRAKDMGDGDLIRSR